MRIGMFVVLVAMVCGALVPPVAAQSNIPEAYFLAPDSTGVRQVWRLTDRAVLTQASAGVVSYDVAGGTVVYSSAGQVWRQAIGGGAEALATLSNGGTGAPAISPNGQQVAYVDGGLWVVPMAGGEARQVFVDKPLNAADASNTQVIQQVTYLSNERVLVSVLRWEWADVGIIDLNSGALALAPTTQFNRAVPLNDGRLALFSDSFMGGVLGLHVAGDITNPTVLVAGADIASEPALIADVVELGSGQLRLLATQFGVVDGVGRPVLFLLDVNTSSNLVSPHPTTTLGSLALEVPRLAPNGGTIAGLAGGTPNFELDALGAYASTLTLYDIGSGQSMAFPELGRVSQFHWAD